MSSKIKLDDDYFLLVAKTGDIFLRKDLHQTYTDKDGKVKDRIDTICYPSTVLNGLKHYVNLKISEKGFDGSLSEYINKYESLLSQLEIKVKM